MPGDGLVRARRRLVGVILSVVLALYPRTFDQSNPDVLSDSVAPGMGAMRKDLGRVVEDVMCRSRCVALRGCKSAHGARAYESRFVQRVPAWGAFDW